MSLAHVLTKTLYAPISCLALKNLASPSVGISFPPWHSSFHFICLQMKRYSCPILSIKEYRGRTGMAPFILNLGIGCRWVASLKSRSLHSRTRAPGNHYIVVLVGLRAGLDILGKIKFAWACRDSNLLSPSPQSRSALRAALVILRRSVPHFLGGKGTTLPSL